MPLKNSRVTALRILRVIRYLRGLVKLTLLVSEIQLLVSILVGQTEHSVSDWTAIAAFGGEVTNSWNTKTAAKCE